MVASKNNIVRQLSPGRSPLFAHFLIFSLQKVLWRKTYLIGCTNPKRESAYPKTLTQAEVIQLLKATTLDETALALRDRAILELLYATGMRATELITLTLDDLDLGTNAIRCMGKGSKERTIPIYPEARGYTFAISWKMGALFYCEIPLNGLFL